MAVTMICIGIPVTMPLWRRLLGKGNSSADRNYKQYERHEENSNPGAYQLDSVQRRDGKPSTYLDGSSKLGLNCTQTTNVRATANDSDEDILPNKDGDSTDFGGSSLNDPSMTGVHVKDEVRVEWNR